MPAGASGSSLNDINQGDTIMTCKEFQKLMYLRDDELDAGELSELKRHRAECAACASEYARVEFSRKVIHDLSMRVPKLTDPLVLINEVIGRIEQDAMKMQPYHPQSVFDRWIVWLSAPGVRAAMAGLLLLITGAFAFEYTSGYVRMKGYEESLERRTALDEPYAMAAGINQRNLLNAASDLSKIISGKQSYDELSDNWVVMNKQSFQEFILLYNELKDNPSELPQEFRAANPGLAKLLETKQPSAQIDMLLKDRESLIR
jgi:hypothetical protein